MSAAVRIGIIGVGGIGTIHAESLAKVSEAQVVAMCDLLPQRLKQQAEAFGVEQRFDDYRKMLEQADIDAVYVCSRNADHCRHAVASLQAGKHVFCEKPMALDAPQARRIESAVQKAGKLLQTGMVWRHRSESRAIKDYVERGELGRIYHMRAVLRRRRGIPGLGGWFTTKALSGGGALIDIGVHFFDLVMWLSNNWEPARVSAAAYAEFGPRMKDYTYVSMWAGPPKLDGVFDVDDYATGLVRFAGGTTLSFEVSWAGNNREDMFIELLGEKGGVRAFDGTPMTIMTEQHGRIVDVHPYSPEVKHFDAQAANFVGAVLGREPPAATARQGVAVMELIDAIYRSAEQGTEVAVDGNRD